MIPVEENLVEVAADSIVKAELVVEGDRVTVVQVEIRDSLGQVIVFPKAMGSITVIVTAKMINMEGLCQMMTATKSVSTWIAPTLTSLQRLI